MNLILDTLFPKKCVGCRKTGSFLCQNCRYQFMQRDLICPKCEKPSTGGQTHPKCQEKYGLDGLWSLGAYQGVLKSVIRSLKYKFIKQLADILVDITIDYWQRHDALFLEEITRPSFGRKGKHWVVTAVPLHWYRENKRGFNQSASIGTQIADKLGLEYQETLKRTRYTHPQVDLKGEQRKANIKDAFSHNTKYLLHNTNLILVDDVWTTGSTLRECCYVLKRAGAKKVWALTLAR